MSKLKFVKEYNITKSFILNHFNGVNISINEWHNMFDTKDFELNLEGKITRREYFARVKAKRNIPYRLVLLFETSEHLFNALLVIGVEPESAKNDKEHEERHAKRIHDCGFKPAFGFIAETKNLKEVPYQAFTIAINWYDVAYAKKISVEEEIKQGIYIADIEGKESGDEEIIQKNKKLLEKYNRKGQEGFLSQWKW